MGERKGGGKKTEKGEEKGERIKITHYPLPITHYPLT
jgi:hypothetical protein